MKKLYNGGGGESRVFILENVENKKKKKKNVILHERFSYSVNPFCDAQAKQRATVQGDELKEEIICTIKRNGIYSTS